MKLHFVNRPVAISRQAYDEALADVADYLAQVPGFLSLYRFGNITTPGISDLDILAVFKNGVTTHITGFENTKPQHANLFTHGIMALCEDHFYKNQHYTLWSDHLLIRGENLEAKVAERKTNVEIEALKIQTALEFLIANYIDLKMQLTYRIIKLRSFLQHVKGLIYDLEFLGINSGSLMNLLAEMKRIILNWFSNHPADKTLSSWIAEFNHEYELFCKEIFAKNAVYLPFAKQYVIARNVELHSAPGPHFRHTGLVLPPLFSGIGKKYINLQNRLNRFKFFFPVKYNSDCKLIEERFSFLKEMKSYNRQHLNGFMTITTSITSKII